MMHFHKIYPPLISPVPYLIPMRRQSHSLVWVSVVETSAREVYDDEKGLKSHFPVITVDLLKTVFWCSVLNDLVGYRMHKGDLIGM